MADADEWLDALESAEPARRADAIRAIAQARRIAAVDALRRVAAHDADEDVRALAASAVSFLERQRRESPRGSAGRRASEPPVVSEDALLRREEALRARQPGLVEYAALGVMAVVGVAVVFWLLTGGFEMLRERLGARPPLAREAAEATIQEGIDAARDAAVRLQQVPSLVGSEAGGFVCANLPAVPATYTLPDPEARAYPELLAAANKLHQARIMIHDAETRWRRQCNADGT